MFRLLFFILHGIRYVNRYIYGFFVKFQFHKFGKRFYIKPYMTVKGGKFICIGNHFSAGSGFRIEAWSKYKDARFEPAIIIGNNVCLGNNCHIGAINKIEIRDNVLMGSNILITDHSHGRTDLEELSVSPLERNLYSKGEVIIEENVWIGDGVVVLPGVKVGNNSVIGANSVITKDVPSYAVVVGNPARKIN